ncbi:unnamed protein product [Discula destructiva]
MALPMVTDVVTGAIFGTALTAAGVFQPSVIIAQMELRNFHMLQVFIGASATSALLVRIASGLNYCPVSVRGPAASLGRLNPYMGNIVGGLMIGTAMAITGACPGTAIVQAALGIPSGIYVMGGGVLGGISYVKLGPALSRLLAPNDAPNSTSSESSTLISKPAAPASSKKVLTLHEKLEIKVDTVLFVYEAMCVLIVGLAHTFAPTNSIFFSPIIGGLFIGGAQASSILLSRKTVGVSTAYGQLGQKFWEILSPAKKDSAPVVYNSVRFALGVALGAKVIATLVPALLMKDAVSDLSRVAMVLGGALMVFGARLAGGCTSGHGISGMATFSLASFVTVAAMFGGGIGVRTLMNVISG